MLLIIERIKLTLKGDFFISATWSLSSSIVSRGMGLLAGIILARTLGKAEYGEFGLIRNSIATISVLTTYGLGLTTTKYISEYKSNNPDRVGTIFSTTVTLICVISLVGILISNIAAPLIIKYQNIQVGNLDDYKIAGLLLLTNGIWEVAQAGLVGFQEFRKLTINNIIYGACIVIFSYIFGLKYGLRGGIVALVISAGIGAFFAFIMIIQIFRKNAIHLSYKWSRENLKILTSFSFPAYLSGILVMPITWWAYSQVAANPNGNAQVGIFNAADQWRTIILFIPQAIGAIALPMLSEAFGRRNKSEFISTIRINSYSVIISSITFAIIIILGRNLILSLYGSDYQEAAIVILYLSYAAIIQSVTAILGQAIAGLGKMWFGVLLNFGWAIACVVGLLSIFPQVAYGLAQTYLFAYTVQMVLSILIVMLLLKYDW